MVVLLLSEEKNEEMFHFLSKRAIVKWQNTKISLKTALDFDWIISYGYRHIIKKDIIDNIPNPIINLHISYLPFNRGSHPNYWSFVDKTPKGVTIHIIDYGIDTGPILVQKECYFSKKDTLKSSYNKLKTEIEKLFFNNFDKIVSGELKAKKQIGIGTYHRKSDLPNNVDWNLNINKL